MAAISVIIPTYNRAEKVSRAISSVISQTEPDFEIIVIDDGSSDETKDLLQKFEPDIKVLYHKDNRGVSSARNAGIFAAESPFIAFLDSDDYWLPEKLKIQKDFFLQYPQAVICQTEEVWIRNGIRVNPKKKHTKPSGDIYIPSLKLCLVSPSSVMLKRSLLDEVGYFDESLPACEDYDLWLRIASRYPVHLINSHLVIKAGGHEDQLSAKYKGMDKFRIKAMIKILKTGVLNQKQFQATINELTEKCQIYGNGCLRRGKRKEGEYYLNLPEKILKGNFDD